jgi:hypothetical protein
MLNRIRKFEIHDRILSPAEAELWIFLDAEHINDRTEVRGRLTGPTCPYADTVEVAYPLRRFPKSPEGLPPLARRVVIPEPSLWDPVTPFLYTGTVELWQDDQHCESVPVRHGLRTTSLSPRGLFWNGALTSLQAIERTAGNRDELKREHDRGFNSMVLPGLADELWAIAEELGFAVFGRTFEPLEMLLKQTASPACLGWIIPAGAINAWDDWQAWIAEVRRRRRLIAIEIEQTPRQALRPEIDAVIAPGQRDIAVDRPKLLRVPAGAFAKGELGQLVIPWAKKTKMQITKT